MTALAAWIRRPLNPILIKDLRATFRSFRFFATYTVIMLVAATILLIAMYIASETGVRSARYIQSGGQREYVDPSQVGLIAFISSFFIHLGVVFLVVPSFGATALVGERERNTYELLTCTGLTPARIVGGKFLSGMVLTFLFFAALLPIVGLIFLFGGISMGMLFSSYITLTLLAALVLSLSLSISAFSKSTQRAVASTYAGALIIGGVIASLAGGLMFSPWMGAVAAAVGLPTQFAGSSSSVGGGLFYVVTYAWPLFLWGTLTSLTYLLAINRLKPSFANRSTNIRIWFVCFALLVPLLLGLTWETSGIVAKQRSEDKLIALGITIGVYGLLMTFGGLFACEDPTVPLPIYHRIQKLKRVRSLFRLFYPGALHGFRFMWLMVTLGALAYFAAVAALTPGTGGLRYGDDHPLYPALSGLAVWGAWGLFCAAFGYFLAAVLPRHRIARRFVWVVVILVLMVVPGVHFWIEVETAPDAHVWHDAFHYGLSPILGMLSAVATEAEPHEIPLESDFGFIRVPVSLVSVVLHTALTVILYLVGTFKIRHWQQKQEGEIAAVVSR